MRHVPTALYIDTCFFDRNGLRFDTKAFNAIKDTFAKGGLRLLVPEMMERELTRHFHRLAEKTSSNVISSLSSYPIDKLSLISSLSKEELKAKCIEEMQQQWRDFKDHFVLEKLPIVGSLEEVVEWYFDVQPPFADKKGKQKEFPDAFIISVLDQYHQQHQANIAVISSDEDFSKACVNRRYIWYFPDLEKYIDAFQPELSGKERLPGDVDITKPIATEDLTELKSILARGDQVTSIEIQRVMQLLEPRGTNYDYFFQHANNVIWLSHLSEAGYFANPPDIEQKESGYIAPWWPPLEYLVRIFESAPNEVLEVVSLLPDTKNFRVLDGIIRIVLKADSVDAVIKLSRFVNLFVGNSIWGHELIVGLLKKSFIFDSQLSEITPSLILKLVEFRPDPQEQEKRSLRKENPEAWNTLLKPTPHYDQWEYQQILENGIRPLADREPFQIARILIDATASMIRMGIHADDFDKRADEDLSELWCRRLDAQENGYQDVQESLVHTLTYACEQVYGKAPQSIAALDQSLRNQQWKIFKRLRQYLYGSHPNEQTLPWIREMVLGHSDYSRWEHHYEFQRMIRKACDHFGRRLLSEEEQSIIVGSILEGPSKEDFREWMGDQYSEDKFKQRRRYFHRMQLRPFASILSSEHRRYYEELEKDSSEEVITDDSYAPNEVKAGSVSYQSPMSIDEMEKFTDAELLTYLNEWDDEHRDKGNWLIEINISALSGVFQSLFKERIIPDNDRLNFWIQNKGKIARPIYVAAMVITMQEFVKEQNFSHLDKWIEFCDWVLSHPDSEKVDGQPDPQEGSRTHPSWGSSRRAVADFIDTCVNQESKTPLTNDTRKGLASLIQKICSQFDWRLDAEKPVFLNRDDPFSEAINNTRSRAFESLVKFGFWIRRNLTEDTPVPEVTDIISQRMADTDLPLTRPEYAMLGAQYGNLCILNKDWASEQKSTLFPQKSISLWYDAFGCYLRYNRPFKMVFDVLHGDFEFALVNLDALIASKNDDRDFVDRLGQHLFTYYLWDAYSLTGEESLLRRFYEETSNDHNFWAQLFDHVGRSLRNSGKHLDQELIDRITKFFDWRFDVAEPLELQKFTFWLEAECLNPEWRLKSYSRILDLGSGKDRGVSIEVRTLNELLSDYLPLVVECFAKITDAMSQNAQMYISPKEAKPILKAGLNAEDPQVRENAERARENLLRLGLFDYLDME